MLSFKTCFKNLRAVGAVLVAGLALGVSTAPWARASDFDLSTLDKQGSELKTHLTTLLRRAKHPNYPGSVPGLPNSSDISQIDSEFAKWKSDLETALALPTSPTASHSTAYLSSPIKNQFVDTYRNQLLMMISLRIALKLPYTGAWLDTQGLRVSREMIQKFPGLGPLFHDKRLGDYALAYQIDRGADGKTDPVHIRLNPAVIRGVELGALMDKPGDETFFTMVQYLATRQLIQNLVQMRYLKRSREVAIPAIPAALTTKLATLGLNDLLIDEQKKALSEPGARAALSARYSQIESQMPPFTDAELVAQFVSIITSGDSTGNRAAGGSLMQQHAALAEGLLLAEQGETAEAIQKNIQSSSFPVTSLAKVESFERAAWLGDIVASAKGQTLLGKFNQLKNSGVLWLTQAQKERILELIDSRRTAYARALPAAALLSWFESAKQASDAELFDAQRSEFIESLIYHAAEVAKDTQATFAGDKVVPSLLARSFAGDLAKMNARRTVQSWLFEVGAKATYSEARETYGHLMAKATDASVVVSGIVDPARVERYLETHNFRPEAGLSADIAPALATKMLDQVVAGRKADIRNWLSIGDLMSFTKVYPMKDPSVRELLTDKDRAEAYYKSLDDAVLTQNPILGNPVDTGTAAQPNSTRLCDALAALNSRLTSDAKVMQRSEGLIDQALEQVEAQARLNLVTVAEAKSLAEIEKVVTSSMMLALVMKGVPEFHVSQEAFINEILSPSVTTQIMHRYGGSFLGYGFGAMMLLHGVTKIAQWTESRLLGPLELIEIGARPLVQGYMSAAMVVIVADTAFQAHELYEKSRKDQQVQDFYRSGVSGSFYEYSEAGRSHSGFVFDAWMFVGRLAMDTVLMYRPMLNGVIAKQGAKLMLREFMGDVEAFNRIGVKPGNWKAVAGAREAHKQRVEALLKLGHESGSVAAVGGFDTKAEARLLAKIAAKNTWSIPTAQETLAREEAFRNLGLKNGQWDKVDEALARKLKSHALSQEEKETVERCSTYLKIVIETDPQIVTRELPTLSKADRKLIDALHNYDFRAVLKQVQATR